MSYQDGDTTLTHRRVNWMIVLGLLALRIPFFTGMAIYKPLAVWPEPVYQIGTYFLTALFIGWERHRLVDFHIDLLGLIVIVVGKPLELFLNQWDKPYLFHPMGSEYWLYLPIAIGLAVAMFWTHPTLSKPTWNTLSWLVIGVISGIGLGLYFGKLMQANIVEYSSGDAPTDMFILLPLQQLLMAGIAEEPCFRGILWGSLRHEGMRSSHIWLIQAGLFWLAHLYALTNGASWSFFYLVPVGAMVLGLLVWKSGSITTSLVAHGLANGTGQIVGFYL